ncbi:MAG TPA: tRNA lysidine(34) synthetase TilS [Bacteroidia bacterium]|nr:tRNA lysidine(34) synthetase TilS [Bacteroidia bacterium]
MIKAFTSYIQSNKLFDKHNKLLVAVSGGTDSMVLCSLLANTGFSFSVAHCNFNLRGAEADNDEKFVLEYCKKNKIKCFSKKFETAVYAKNKGISIQMAARELRYSWFNELITSNDFDYLLTAHHANDNIETFFINLLRGSGINGLKAILPKKDKTVRPLLFATRIEIEGYLKENKILFREDSSNKEDKYLRNHLRLQVIPALKKINPSFEKTVSAEIEILQQTNLILQKEVEKQRKKLLLKEDSAHKINIEQLEKTIASKLILFELIKDFGFNSSQANDVYNSLKAQSGKVFTSETHTIIKDREFLLIKKNEQENQSDIFINENTTSIKSPIKIKIEFTKGSIDSIPKKDFKANKAFIDADKLVFPLILNKWQLGDKFKPLGMKGFKKVSDFFTAEKASLFDKQNQYILRCNKDIVWLVGKRVDDRFKVNTSTTKICIISII